MGGEWGTTSDGQKCFNAAKTYYLGWYAENHGDVSPTQNSFDGSLVGVNDAVNGEISDQYVTIRILDSGATDLYLMYNRVEGVNKFLEDNRYRDKVVVVEQDGAGELSWVKSILDQGETYTQNNWAGTGSSSSCLKKLNVLFLYQKEAHLSCSINFFTPFFSWTGNSLKIKVRWLPVVGGGHIIILSIFDQKISVLQKRVTALYSNFCNAINPPFNKRFAT